jgi:hypothetical protein
MVDVLERNNVVARLYIGDTLTNRLDVSGTFVTEDNGKGTLGVLAGECVGICVADTGVVDLDADFMGPGRENLNLLDGEVLAGFPSNCSLVKSVPVFCLRHLHVCGSRTCASARHLCKSSADPHAKAAMHCERGKALKDDAMAI